MLQYLYHEYWGLIMGDNVKDKKEEKCFIIMPISDQGDYPAGHFTKVYEQIIKPAVTDAGYEPYRVDENNICDAIINKIFTAIQDCPMAICDLSNRNPNVLYELGLRQAYDKPVVLIQDEKTDKIFDVSGISTVFYKSGRLYEDVIEARENIKNAILATKEGKVNSLAKIMKASVPDFSQVEVSQDDKMNVILDGIYNELRQINSKKVKEDSKNNISNIERYINNVNKLIITYDLMNPNVYIKKEDIPRLYEELGTIRRQAVIDEKLSTRDKIHVKHTIDDAESLLADILNRKFDS